MKLQPKITWSQAREDEYRKTKFSRNTALRPRRALLRFAERLNSEYEPNIPRTGKTNQSSAAILGERSDNQFGAQEAFKHTLASDNSTEFTSRYQVLQSSACVLSSEEKQARERFLQQKCNEQRVAVQRKKRRRKRVRKSEGLSMTSQGANSGDQHNDDNLLTPEHSEALNLQEAHGLQQHSLKPETLSATSSTANTSVERKSASEEKRRLTSKNLSENPTRNSQSSAETGNQLRPTSKTKQETGSPAKNLLRGITGDKSPIIPNNLKPKGTAGKNHHEQSKKKGQRNRGNGIFLTQISSQNPRNRHERLLQSMKNSKKPSQGAQTENKNQKHCSKSIEAPSKRGQMKHINGGKNLVADNMRKLSDILETMYLTNAVKGVEIRDPLQARTDFKCVQDVEQIAAISNEDGQIKRVIKLGKVYGKINNGLPQLRNAFHSALASKEQSISLVKRLFQEST